MVQGGLFNTSLLALSSVARAEENTCSVWNTLLTDRPLLHLMHGSQLGRSDLYTHTHTRGLYTIAEGQGSIHISNREGESPLSIKYKITNKQKDIHILNYSIQLFNYSFKINISVNNIEKKCP